MSKSLDVGDLMARPYARMLSRDESGAWNAEALELPGCFTDGPTLEEALENLDEVMHLWFEVKLEDGGHIPQPWDSGSYNGRILLRVPKSVHREVAKRAKADGVSINQWLLAAVSEKLGYGYPAAKSGTSSSEKLSTIGNEFADAIASSLEAFSTALDPDVSLADAIGTIRETRTKYVPSKPKKPKGSD